jgi:hypothetical protein
MLSERDQEKRPAPFGKPKTNYKIMLALTLFTPVLGAIGFSLLYLVLGGGLGGAVLIFIIAKMLGR